MKKSIIIFLALLLLFPMILAQEAQAPDTQTNEAQAPDTQAEEAQTPDIKEASETFKEEFKKQRESVDEWADKTELPEFFQGPTKFLFNLKNEEKYETLYLEDAIIFLMVLFMFFLIIQQSLTFIGVIKEGYVTILTAIAISILGSIFGGMTYLATFYIDFVNAVGEVSKIPVIASSGWGMLFYIPLLILIIIIWFVFDIIKTWIHRSDVKTIADVKAMKLKNAIKQIKVMAKEELD